MFERSKSCLTLSPYKGLHDRRVIVNELIHPILPSEPDAVGTHPCDGLRAFDFSPSGVQFSQLQGTLRALGPQPRNRLL
jgi:hypothetical protein